MASEMQVFYIIDLPVCINRIHMNVHNDFLYKKKQHFNARFSNICNDTNPSTHD